MTKLTIYWKDATRDPAIFENANNIAIIDGCLHIRMVGQDDRKTVWVSRVRSMTIEDDHA